MHRGAEDAAEGIRLGVDLEICAFAQEGLANVPEADKALVEAIEMGATSIGGAPNYDTDHPAHINRVFELAREYDIHVDLHIDSGHDRRRWTTCSLRS